MVIIKVIGSIFVAYLFLILLGFLFQRYLIYQPSLEIAERPERQIIPMHIVNITSDKNLVLKSWYKRAAPGKVTLIYFQGNAGNIADRAQLIQPYLAQGMGVLLVGYRGYGGNPGRATEEGLYQDARAAWNYLRNNKVPSSCIVLYGESIGAAVAIQLATENSTAAVILEAPFTSLIELAKQYYPIFPINWILSDRYLSDQKISEINSPLLVLVAQDDRIVPVGQSRRLYELAKHPKQIKFYEGVGHNQLHFVVHQDVVRFLQKQLTDCGDSNKTM